MKIKPFLLFAFLIISTNIKAANYPLEIISPREAGTGNPAIGANNRIFKAYPGLPYNIRAAVVGGVYPYKYYLTNAPNGMTINENTGEVNWPNPQVNASATIRVVDTEGSQITNSWSIKVTTSGFHFVDASAPDGGDGSYDHPWNDTFDFMAESKWNSDHAGDFLYFKTGIYYIRGSIENEVRMAFYSGIKPSVWMAYPGEKPVFDCERTYHFSGGQDDFYLDGLEFRNGADRFISTWGNYSTYRNLYLHDIVDSIGGFNNQSLIGNVYGKCFILQNCLFEDSDKPCGVKMYSIITGLVEDCIFRNLRNSEGIAVKSGNVRVTVRNNVISDIQRSITCNAYEHDGNGCNDNEYLYNLIYNSEEPMKLGDNGHLGLTYVYRNTIIGIPIVSWVTGTQGPVKFTDNVIINAGGGNIKASNSDENLIISDGNITGTIESGIVDKAPLYLLSNSYGQYIGKKGYQKGTTLTGVVLPHNDAKHEEFSLSQNYPNPFAQSTTIEYTLNENAPVTISILDITGRNIKTLVNQSKTTGTQSVLWDGTSDAGQKVVSGVYFYQLKTGKGIMETKKLLFIQK